MNPEQIVAVKSQVCSQIGSSCTGIDFFSFAAVQIHPPDFPVGREEIQGIRTRSKSPAGQFRIQIAGAIGRSVQAVRLRTQIDHSLRRKVNVDDIGKALSGIDGTVETVLRLCAGIAYGVV